MAKGTRDLARLLKQADAAYPPTSVPSRAAGTAGAHQELSAFIRLSLDDHTAARRLQQAAARLAPGWGPDVTAATILDETLALTGAELGTVQIAEPGTQRLRIVAHAGFGPEFLDHFESVDDDTSACGRAAARHSQAVIADVDDDEDYAPHRGVAAASKFRAVQSTPLIDADGNLVGVVSTHFPRPGAPAERDLEVVRLYGLVAGEALARSLSPRAGPGLGEGQGDAPGWPEPAQSPARTAILDLTDAVVRSLLSAGLSLAGAQSLIADRVASEKVAAAIGEVDQALGGLRSVVLDLSG